MSRKKTSSPFDDASERLADAFARLEQATQSASTKASQSSGDDALKARCQELEAEAGALRSDHDFLRDDNARLSNQLQELQQEYLRLKELSTSVADRIDDQVEQLDLIAQI